MKDRWLNLNLREKRIVSAGVLGAILLIFYALIWSPVSDKSRSLIQQLQQDQKLLTWMQAADARIQSLEKNLQPSSKTTKSILNIVQMEINRSAFKDHLTGFKQAEQNAVQVNLKEIAFDDLTQWLIQLWQKQGIQVLQISATRANVPGLVTVDIILT